MVIFDVVSAFFTVDATMGVDHGGRGDKSPPEFGAGGFPPDSPCFKILSTRLVALQCRKMCFCLYSRTCSKYRHVSPQKSSQIYAYRRNVIPLDQFSDDDDVVRTDI